MASHESVQRTETGRRAASSIRAVGFAAIGGGVALLAALYSDFYTDAAFSFGTVGYRVL